MHPRLSAIFLCRYENLAAKRPLIGIAASCQKDDVSPITSNANLEWRGDYEADGCGFFVVVGNVEYKPENESIIEDSFKTSEDVEVIVEYKKSGKQIRSFCQWGVPQDNEGIRIVSLKRK